MPLPVPVDAFACSCWCLCMFLLMPLPVPVDVFVCSCRCLCLFLLMPLPVPVEAFACSCWCLCLFLLMPLPVPVDAFACSCRCLCLFLSMPLPVHWPTNVIEHKEASTCWHSTRHIGLNVNRTSRWGRETHDNSVCISAVYTQCIMYIHCTIQLVWVTQFSHALCVIITSEVAEATSLCHKVYAKSL